MGRRRRGIAVLLLRLACWIGRGNCRRCRGLSGHHGRPRCGGHRWNGCWRRRRGQGWNGCWRHSRWRRHRRGRNLRRYGCGHHRRLRLTSRERHHQNGYRGETDRGHGYSHCAGRTPEDPRKLRAGRTNVLRCKPVDHTGAARATKYIFVSGGVVSSVGKGITVASIGRLLKARGISVCILKLDPYINVDPGTMSPYQHGEVFVTDDGAETDLDLGHYERFIDENLSRLSNVTTGQIYSAVIGRERRGDFLGGTIQVVPHVTNEIKERIERVARQTNAEVIIAEVGGTVGDIECQPLLEALRQIHRELERDRTLFVHLTLLPYVGATGELKTKPTQHSVKELRSIGIQPDVICARSDYPVPDDMRDKIALFCDVERRAVVPLETADTIYSVPLILESAGLGDFIVERLGLPDRAADLDGWRELVHRSRTVKDEVVIGVVGKYVELQDAYISVREGIHHAAWTHNRKPVIRWIDSQHLEQADEDWERILEGLHGIIVPGGFGYRGVEGKIRAAQFARENKVPYLGLCLGMQRSEEHTSG